MIRTTRIKTRCVLLVVGLLFLLGAFVFSPAAVKQHFDLEGMLNNYHHVHITHLRIVLSVLGFALLAVIIAPVNVRLVIISTLLSVFVAEMFIRINPSVVGNDFADKVLSKYKVGLSGIYLYDRELDMYFMKPNFKAKSFFRGYRWTHQTDSYGFRNAETKEFADIVLLGDSYIYGHGVNYDQTVGYFLEKISKHTVVNLGRTGDCVIQQMYLLAQYGVRFKSKYVLYFLSENDVDQDLHGQLTDDEMRSFINTPVEDITYGARTNSGYKEPRIHPLFAEFLDNGFYLVKAVEFVRYLLHEDGEDDGPSDGDERYYDDPEILEWKYIKRAILQMKHVCEMNSVTLVVASIPDTDKPYIAILKDFAKENGIPFIDTSSIGEKEIYYLPEDGHFNEKGARKMAEIIAQWLENNE